MFYPLLGFISEFGNCQANFDRYAMPVCPSELTAPVLHQGYPSLATDERISALRPEFLSVMFVCVCACVRVCTVKF